MAKSSASPRSQQRLRVFDAYRGRGRRINALWLIYSFKTNRDWILSSDRQLVHWLVFLETDPSVKSFDLVPSEEGLGDKGSVAVLLADGSKETHRVIAGIPAGHECEPAREDDEQHGRVRTFSDVDLKPRVPQAMRWHKALSYAAAIRDKEYLQIRLALVPLIRSLGNGTIGQITNEMASFEEPSIFGILVRLAVEGHVSIDLSAFGFCHATPWNWREEGKHVVA